MEQATKRARLSGAEGTVAGSGVLEPVELVEPTAAHHDAKLAEPAASATDQTCVIMSRADGAGEGATSSHQQQQTTVAQVAAAAVQRRGKHWRASWRLRAACAVNRR